MYAVICYSPDFFNQIKAEKAWEEKAGRPMKITMADWGIEESR